jgi:hypothetical protein
LTHDLSKTKLIDDRTNFIHSPHVSQRIVCGTPDTCKAPHPLSNNPYLQPCYNNRKSHRRHPTTTNNPNPKNPSQAHKTTSINQKKQSIGSFGRPNSLLQNEHAKRHTPKRNLSVQNKISYYGVSKTINPDFDTTLHPAVLQPPTELVKKFEEFFCQVLSGILFGHTRFSKFLIYIKDSTIRDVVPDSIQNLASNTLRFLHDLIYKEENLHRF